jgi:hypothetical protein
MPPIRRPLSMRSTRTTLRTLAHPSEWRADAAIAMRASTTWRTATRVGEVYRAPRIEGRPVTEPVAGPFVISKSPQARGSWPLDERAISREE